MTDYLCEWLFVSACSSVMKSRTVWGAIYLHLLTFGIVPISLWDTEQHKMVEGEQDNSGHFREEPTVQSMVVVMPLKKLFKYKVFSFVYSSNWRNFVRNVSVGARSTQNTVRTMLDITEEQPKRNTYILY